MAKGGKQPGAGRPKGSKNTKTVEMEAAREQFRQLVLKRIKPIFESQYSLVKGVAYLYRIEETRHGGKEHILVTNPVEIGDVLSQMDSWEGQVVNDQYYYVTVRAPENNAIKDMLDRTFGRPQQSIDHTTGGDKFEMGDVRALLALLPKERQQEFYAIISNILAEAELPAGGSEVSGDSA